MTPPTRLRSRYRRILTFFGGVIMRFIFWELFLARLGLRRWVRRTRPGRFRADAVRFRALAIAMGGVMIKVGQFLSSRLDVLPPEVTDELAGLQDEVPAEAYADIRRIAEDELGGPLAERFAWFSEIPLAAASLGQVHRARLLADAGEPFQDVVVKILRPDIEQVVEVDLAALRIVGAWLMRYRPVRAHADVPMLLGEFADTIREEIDYLHEGRNAETFAANFAADARIHVPRVVWARTTRRVLTLEDVFAIKISDYEGITRAGIDRAEVASRLLGTYLKQIFEDGFFHADPHPGNLFISPRDGGAWQLTFVDFGMVGQVPQALRAGLQALVVAVGTRDAAGVVRAYQLLGMLLPGADLRLIEQAEAQVFDRFWGMSMSELRGISPDELRKFAHQYRDLMLSMPFQVPNNLLMLLRTVAILSGMCTGLDPDFNLWAQLAPYARTLVEKEGTAGLGSWLERLGEMLRTALALPTQASQVLARLDQGRLEVQVPQVSRRLDALQGAVDRLTAAILAAALLLGGILLLNAGQATGGWGLLGAAGAVTAWLLFLGGRKNGG